MSPVLERQVIRSYFPIASCFYIPEQSIAALDAYCNKRGNLGLTLQIKRANLLASQDDRLLNGASQGRLIHQELRSRQSEPTGARIAPHTLTT